MGTSIVCGVDESPDSQAALQVAVGLADRLQRQLVVAHVAEPAHTPYVTAVEEVASQEKASKRLLEDVIGASGLIDAESRTAIGHPAERLADIADEVDAELIVVGSRGRGAFKSAFLGSVSTALVGIARCPVLIVPHGAEPTA